MNMNFMDLIKRLSEECVDYVIVGGFAATLYGCTMVTQDLDICLRFSTENLRRLAAALNGLNPVHRMTPGRKPLSVVELENSDLKNLYLDTDIGVLDCLGEISGVGGFDLVSERSIRLESEGVVFRAISLDALIETKESLGRERDKQAVIQLKSIRQAEDNKHS